MLKLTSAAIAEMGTERSASKGRGLENLEDCTAREIAFDIDDMDSQSIAGCGQRDKDSLASDMAKAVTAVDELVDDDLADFTDLRALRVVESPSVKMLVPINGEYARFFFPPGRAVATKMHKSHKSKDNRENATESSLCLLCILWLPERPRASC